MWTRERERERERKCEIFVSFRFAKRPKFSFEPYALCASSFAEYVFVPTQHWRHSFLRRYDPKLGDIKKKTSYNQYLAQEGHALANTFAMRSLYEVEGCKGIISNVDQAMHYRWYGGDRAYKLRR